MEYITLSGDGIHLDVPRRCRMIGVYSEHMARAFSFRLPIKPTPLVNLTECTIFVTFVNARGATCRQMITDWQIDGDSIIFSWTLDGRVFVTPGVVRYNVYATRRDENDHPIYEWYTTTAKAIVTEGCTYGETPEEYPPDFGPLLSETETARIALQGTIDDANTANTTLTDTTQTANDASDDLQSYIGMAASMSEQLAEDYVLQRIVSLEDAVCTKKVTSYLRIDSESLLSADDTYAFGADDSFDYGADVISLKEKTNWMQCIVDGLMTKISDKDDIISELTERIAILEEKHENDNVYLLAD